ncbi:MAG: GNAT family N-acetyltransferase [Thermoanaerobaculaceae bacterium]|jgi:ribosomal-protein-alanine N-acetyltransferase|nr:GNAT family N-acetyltransferase [Thermoanaerobaculaceae bacterium]
MTPVGPTGRVPVSDPLPSDLAELVGLDRLCFGERAWPARAWWEVLHEPGWQPRVIRTRQVIIGATVLLPAPSVASLASIAVHPAWRQRGLGWALLDDAIRLAGQAGARWLALNVDQGQTVALRMYRKRGFGASLRYVEDGIPRLEMLRRLRRGTLPCYDVRRHG